MNSLFLFPKTELQNICRVSAVYFTCFKVHGPDAMLQNVVGNRTSNFVWFYKPSNRLINRCKISNTPSTPYFCRVLKTTSFENNAKPLSSMVSRFLLPHKYIF